MRFNTEAYATLYPRAEEPIQEPVETAIESFKATNEESAIIEGSGGNDGSNDTGESVCE